MTMRRAWLLLSMAALAAAIVFDLWVYGQWKHARALASLEAAAQSDPGRIAADSNRKAGLGGDVPSAAAPWAADLARREHVAEKTSSAAAAPIDWKQLIAKDAQLRARAMDLTRAVTPFTYALLFRMLQLSPDQQSQLTDILTQMEEGKYRIASIAADQGLTADDPQIKAIQAQQSQLIHTQLENVLGPDGMAELQRYWNAGADLWMVNDVAGILPPNSLTVAQLSQLLYTLADASQKFPNGVAMVQTVNVSQAVTNAASFLSPDQLVTLSAFLQQQEAYRQMRALSSPP